VKVRLRYRVYPPAVFPSCPNHPMLGALVVISEAGPYNEFDYIATTHPPICGGCGRQLLGENAPQDARVVNTE